MNLSCKQFRRSGVSALCSAGLYLALTGALLAAECPPAGERFVADGEETIIDTQSLLMWRRCPEGLQGDRCQQGSLLGFNWRQGVERLAQNNAAGLAGYDDWGIPTLAQLQTLTSGAACAKGDGAAAVLPSWPDGYFWSRSSPQGKSYVKRTFSLETGQPALSNQGTYGVNLWLVRRLE
jgi:hypothetical protein